MGKIDISLIERDVQEEKLVGIDNIVLFSFTRELWGGTTYLYVYGEIYASRVVRPYSFNCIVYDDDYDIIATTKNCNYGWIQNRITKKSFYNRYPVEFCVELPKNANISKIKIEVID